VARILVIERTGSFSSALKKRYDVTSVPNGKLALELARANEYAVVVLDAISMRTPGDRIARQLREGLGTIPLIHLHPGTKESADTPAEAVLFLPFTARKLNNTIERLLHPVGGESVVTCGQFSVNVTRRVLVANGQETTLTPKLALLVETFFRHPGVTLDRKLLMERVWDTSYMGDTRTLDVHIRWIRRAIEENPSDPRYLRTVRGVGYRLEIPADAVAAASSAVAAPTARRVRTKLTLQEA
jgi:DNA-binding response OmpR family regulator